MTLTWTRPHPWRLVSTDGRYRLTNGAHFSGRRTPVWAVSVRRGRRWECLAAVAGLQVAKATAAGHATDREAEV